MNSPLENIRNQFILKTETMESQVFISLFIHNLYLKVFKMLGEEFNRSNPTNKQKQMDGISILSFCNP